MNPREQHLWKRSGVHSGRKRARLNVIMGKEGGPAGGQGWAWGWGSTYQRKWQVNSHLLCMHNERYTEAWHGGRALMKASTIVASVRGRFLISLPLSVKRRWCSVVAASCCKSLCMRCEGTEVWCFICAPAAQNDFSLLRVLSLPEKKAVRICGSCSLTVLLLPLKVFLLQR